HHLVSPPIAPERIPPAGADQILLHPHLAHQRKEPREHRAEELCSSIDGESVLTIRAGPTTQPPFRLVDHHRDAGSHQPPGRSHPRRSSPYHGNRAAVTLHMPLPYRGGRRRVASSPQHRWDQAVGQCPLGPLNRPECSPQARVPARWPLNREPPP